MRRSERNISWVTI